jgi:hypothetical protein
MSHITAIDSSPPAGDFARGQRRDIALGHTDCDFATGQRHAGVPGITGDFATGLRTSSLTRAVGDFATGMRSLSIPVIDVDLLVEENVQLAA